MWKVTGQSRAVALLKRSLETGSVAHAYLFVGPEHVGKMTLALSLAQALNCETSEPPCGECVSCGKIASDKHADVQVIGLGQGSSGEAKEISIEQIRDLQHSATLPPFEGRKKVFIIDGAELLSLEAANCLLKTLEEPADKVVFVLLTTNERLLPSTVVSRCQRVELLPLAVTEVEAALEKNWGVDRQKARLLARLSHGCLGWAVQALDDSFLRQRTECLNELIELANADCEQRFAYAARLAVQFGESRQLVQERLDLWLEWWRDLLLTKLGSGDAVTDVDRLDILTGVARDYELAEIWGFIKNIRVAGDQLRLNANPRLVLESLMLSMPEAGSHHSAAPSARLQETRGLPASHLEVEEA
jgi:DNA polymerase-3 subunit delta'